MRALKCDRCGKLYESILYTQDITVERDRHPYGTNRIDLCMDCYRQLEEWLSCKENVPSFDGSTLEVFPKSEFRKQYERKEDK